MALRAGAAETKTRLDGPREDAALLVGGKRAMQRVQLPARALRPLLEKLVELLDLAPAGQEHKHGAWAHVRIDVLHKAAHELVRQLVSIERQHALHGALVKPARLQRRARGLQGKSGTGFTLRLPQAAVKTSYKR